MGRSLRPLESVHLSHADIKAFPQINVALLLTAVVDATPKARFGQ
jgi:hypothetical protein